MCAECSWESYADIIEEMLHDDKFDFASSTLQGIQQWVEENEHISEKQENAVDNIKAGGERNNRSF